MKRFLSFTLILCLLMGCSGAVSAPEAQVYRVISPAYQTTGRLLQPENIIPHSGETQLESVIRALGEVSADDRIYNPIADIDILGCEVKDGLAILNMDDSYMELTGLDKTLADACCTLTLCAMEGIDRVSIACGKLVLSIGLSPDNLYLDIGDTENIQRQVYLYYTDKEHHGFTAKSRSMTAGSGRAERYIVEDLLRSHGELVSPLPEGTELLGVTRKGQICTLNLSAEFLENRPDSPTGEILAVYSLVNSLATLGNITGVVFTVEGQPVADYLDLSLANPIAPLPFLPSDAPASEQTGAKLYFAADGTLFGVPCVVDAGRPQHMVLKNLMDSGSFGPYESLFTPQDELRHISTENGVTRISVSRSFFEKRTLQQSSLALDALTLSLLELEDVASVIVSYPDGTVPRLPERDLAKPILPKAEIMK